MSVVAQTHPKWFSEFYKSREAKFEQFLRVLHGNEPFCDFVIKTLSPRKCIIIKCGLKGTTGCLYAIDGAYAQGSCGDVPPIDERFWERIGD